MKRSIRKRPLTGLSLLAASLVIGASSIQAAESDRQLYDSVFSSKSRLTSKQVPADHRLSYETYEHCFRTYRDIVAFNVDHSATHKRLVERQEAMLTRQEELALMRMKAQTTQDRAQRIQWINRYDSEAQSFNHDQDVLQADLEAFLPIFTAYRDSYHDFTQSCSRMYYDEQYMQRLPEDLKADYRRLINEASSTEG